MVKIGMMVEKTSVNAAPRREWVQPVTTRSKCTGSAIIVNGVMQKAVATDGFGATVRRLKTAVIEAVSKLGYWFQIRRVASFPAWRDFPPDRFPPVGRIPKEDIRISSNF